MSEYKICIHYRDKGRQSEYLTVQEHMIRDGVLRYNVGSIYQSEWHIRPMDIIDEVVVQR